MTKSDDYLWDRSGSPDADVARLEGLLGPLAHDAPLDELRLKRKRRLVPWLAGAVVAIGAAVALVLVLRPGASAPCAGGTGFAFEGEGTVTCNDGEVSAGVLPIGGTLDTGANSAVLRIADIGTAALGAQTRVRLDRTAADRHQLYLERGVLHARVVAPPRIFAVATPSTEVVDLGCEYEISIDDKGAGTIRVLSGKVELEHASGAVFVAPAHTRARLLPGRRASLPLVDNASAQLRAAVERWDGGGDVDDVLAAATPGDAITIANLGWIESPRRRDVLTRLAELAPPPQQLTVEEAVGDRALYEMWFDEIALQFVLATHKGP